MGKDLNYKIYTPEIYSVNMVKDSLERYLKNFNDKKLENLRVIDISCGSGNLLLPMLEELIKTSKKLYGEYRFNKNWITGYDIDGNALEIFKKRAEIIFSKYGILGELNLKKCNSLYEKIEKKYHIVLGNPPYLGEKHHKEIFHEIKETDFGKKYYEPKMDYFYFFIEKGIDILEDKGILNYLTTNYWLKADSAGNLRKKLKEEGSFGKLENYTYSIFKSAVGQHNVIFCWEKKVEIEDIEILEDDFKYFMKKSDIYLGESDKIALLPPVCRNNIKNIQENSNTTLGELVNVNQGIVSGADKVFVFDEFKDEFKEYLRPFYKNKDIGKYNVSKIPPFWILYLDKHIVLDENILNYLESYKEKLSKRREVAQNRINWWELQWSRDEEIFKKEKIVVRQRCKTNNFAYVDKEFYGSADIYYLTKKREETSLFYILGYLNSREFFEWFNYIGKKKGKNLEFYSTPLKECPVYYSEDLKEVEYIEKLVKMQINEYSEKTQKEIDEYFKEKLNIK
nr:TaqI-like C-terminal specificity domain-containing protein [uncultured Cetobacterium sp.]